MASKAEERNALAELAKVGYVVDCDGGRIYLPAQSSNATNVCRAIAEEGAKHGE